MCHGKRNNRRRPIAQGSKELQASMGRNEKKKQREGPRREREKECSGRGRR